MAASAPNLQALPSSMGAWKLDAFGSPYELPKPEDPNDILIKVNAASFCHTDAILAAGKYINAGGPPLEFSGTVVQSNSPDFSPGDRAGHSTLVETASSAEARRIPFKISK